MNAIPFDTPKRPTCDQDAAGLAAPVAAGASADVLAGDDPATRSDRIALGINLAAGIEHLRRDLTIKFGGMLFVDVGVILAAIWLMPNP